MRELLDGKQMLIKKKELRLSGGLFAAYFRISGADSESAAKFGNFVKKIHRNRAVGIAALPEGASLFFIPISHLAMDLGIPPVKDFGKSLHCVSFNYRSLGNLSSKNFSIGHLLGIGGGGSQRVKSFAIRSHPRPQTIRKVHKGQTGPDRVPPKDPRDPTRDQLIRFQSQRGSDPGLTRGLPDPRLQIC